MIKAPPAALIALFISIALLRQARTAQFAIVYHGAGFIHCAMGAAELSRLTIRVAATNIIQFAALAADTVVAAAAIIRGFAGPRRALFTFAGIKFFFVFFFAFAVFVIHLAGDDTSPLQTAAVRWTIVIIVAIRPGSVGVSGQNAHFS